MRHQIGVQKLLADVGFDRDFIVSGLVFGAKHLVARDIAFGVGVDPVVDYAVVFYVGPAVDEHADLLLDSLTHCRMERVAFSCALSCDGHGRS